MNWVEIDPQTRRLRAQLAARGLEKSAFLAYLRGGAVVLAARSVSPDRIDPAAKPIPRAFATDGEWMWSWEAIAYADRYDISFPDAFLDHVAAVRASVPVISPEQKHEALSLLGVHG